MNREYFYRWYSATLTLASINHAPTLAASSQLIFKISCAQTMIIVVLGTKGCGKSALCHALVRQQFNFDHYISTIEDSYHFSIESKGSAIKSYHLIDTAGINVDDFVHMRNTYFQMEAVFLLVFSITSVSSMLALGPLMDQITAFRHRHNLATPIFLLVATHSDLLCTIDAAAQKKKSNPINKEQMDRFIIERNLEESSLIITSARTTSNIDLVRQALYSIDLSTTISCKVSRRCRIT